MERWFERSFKFVMFDWFEVIFSEEEERIAKETHRKEFEKAKAEGKEEYLHSENSWIGILGEEAVRRMFCRWGYIEGVDFKLISVPFETDPYDFEIGNNLTADVKLTSVAVYPKAHYECGANADQVDWNRFDILILGRYCLPQRRAIIMGWEWRSEFHKEAVRLEAGVQYTPYLKPETDYYSIPIKKLKPLLDIDKHKMGTVDERR